MKNLFKKYVLAFIILNAQQAFSQIPISLETAVDKAFQNNLTLQNGLLRIEYQDRIRSSYREIEPLQITAELGQMNSIYFDNRFSATQTFRLPKFYNAQKMVLEEEWKNAGMHLEIQKWQLRKELALIYNNLNYLDEKEKLLQQADSIYRNFFRNAELRLKAGESSILEKTTAEAYRSEAQMQLNGIRKDREILLFQFNNLINGSEKFTNESGSFFSQDLMPLPENFGENSFVLRQLQQQKNIENARLEAEKAKLLPSFSIGVNSMTMKGAGADNKEYDYSKRFHSAQIGVAIPLFTGAQKSVIEGQKINQQIAENNYAIGLKQLQNQYAQSFGEFEKLKSEVDYYKTAGIANAEKILFTANLLLKEGETDYLEYSILVNQALEIKNKYIDAQKLLNEKIIELNALHNQ
ncbi:Outer membrane protein TolC [Cruoricaptor ignavus]|uniref:Outer membrane protein TolC n=1 Tax=Cruoricaptor ignavus TaxID=1118202 RepID=A0A1M6A0Y6_9FLAO|nr:TolC family protein [Cruoricaptor ignavus]SHI30076.1 Outer membrane protein TolC [Cruoricaptor ignavus]